MDGWSTWYLYFILLYYMRPPKEINRPAAITIEMVVALLWQLAVLNLLLSSAAAHTTTASNYSDFQQLNVKETIAEIKVVQLQKKPNIPNDDIDEELHLNDQQLPSSEEGGKYSWKMQLFHRDKITSSSVVAANSYDRRFNGRIKRDVKRVAALFRWLSPLLPSTNSSGHEEDQQQVVVVEEDDFGSEVTSGADQGSGEYFVRIGVGSPPRSQYMVIDSGSDVIWVQCQPCNQCYRQSDPVFDPADSVSFAGVSCSSDLCGRLQNARCHAGRCRYEVLYGDGSYTKGTLALETLTFGNITVRGIAIGCGHMNQGMFVGAAGLLGLGGGSMSFVSQLGGQTGGAFTYCLLSRGIGSNGSLAFGRGSLPVGAAWVPLLRNPQAPSFYYVGLSGLGIGGVQLPIPEDVFRLSESGEGGVVMDTGTAVSRFPTDAYVAFRDAFITQTASLPRSPAVSIFDTCYNLNGFESVRVPTVSFYFTGGPILTLPANNFLIPVDEVGTFCLAFGSSGNSGLSIIGNIQQEGIQISFDGANGFVGFGPNVC